MSKIDKTPRTDVRQAPVRATTWTPPSLLPDPNPRPGLVHRWCRHATLAVEDPMNMSVRVREGWSPVKREDYPELSGYGDRTDDGTIKMGGEILCSMPEEMALARREYYENIAKEQQRSIDSQLMSNSNSKMPIHRPRRASQTQFGPGARLSNFDETE